jgi:hypothetical protein
MEHIWELRKFQKTLKMHRIWIEFIHDFKPADDTQLREQDLSLDLAYDELLTAHDKIMQILPQIARKLHTP